MTESRLILDARRGLTRFALLWLVCLAGIGVTAVFFVDLVLGLNHMSPGAASPWPNEPALRPCSS